MFQGDTTCEFSKIYPLKEIDSLRDIISNPDLLKGKRTEVIFYRKQLGFNENTVSPKLYFLNLFFSKL